MTYGAVQGAVETGASPKEIADIAVEIAGEMAIEHGMPEEETVRAAALASDQAIGDTNAVDDRDSGRQFAENKDVEKDSS